MHGLLIVMIDVLPLAVHLNFYAEQVASYGFGGLVAHEILVTAQSPISLFRFYSLWFGGLGLTLLTGTSGIINIYFD